MNHWSHYYVTPDADIDVQSESVVVTASPQKSPSLALHPSSAEVAEELSAAFRRLALSLRTGVPS